MSKEINKIGYMHPKWDDLITLFKEGNTAEIKSLFQNVPELLATEERYHTVTPLHLAVLHNNREIVKILLDERPELNEIADHNYDTPFDRTIRYGNIDLMKLFLAAQPDLIKKVDRHKNTVLDLAIKHGQHEIADYLMECAPQLVDTLTNKITANNNKYHVMASKINHKHETTGYIKGSELDLDGISPNEIIDIRDIHRSRITILDVAIEKNQYDMAALLIRHIPKLSRILVEFSKHESIKWFFEKTVSLHTKNKDITQLVYSYLANKDGILIDNICGEIALYDPEPTDAAQSGDFFTIHLGGQESNEA